METTKSYFSRIALFLGAAVCALALAFTLVGCGGSSDEDKIKEAVSHDFEILKAGENITEALPESAQTEFASLSQYGINSDELLSAWFDGFDYSVGEIVIDEEAGTATVAVSVTSKQLYTSLVDWTEDFIDWAYANVGVSQSELMEYAGTSLMDAVKNTTPVTTDVTFDMEKADGEWIVANTSTNTAQFSAAILGDEDELNKTMNSLS